jgi:hypothetical protein
LLPDTDFFVYCQKYRIYVFLEEDYFFFFTFIFYKKELTEYFNTSSVNPIFLT